jgi:hypothetical protein
VTSTTVASKRALPRDVRLFFKGDAPFARRGQEEWSIGDVKRGEMIFSPDGRRFAYVRGGREARSTEPIDVAARASVGVADRRRVLVRNIAGDPVNEFPVYHPGEPEVLTWLDNRRLGYLAPPDAARVRRQRVFVTHDAESGEVLSARSGNQFVWDAGHRHVAFVSGPPGRQTLVVDGQNVWPRSGTTRFHGDFVWSADGHGLALVDTGPAGDRPRLIVLAEWSDRGGDLSWPIPVEALQPGVGVFWAGDSKVVIGESALKPKFAAGWERVQ